MKKVVIFITGYSGPLHWRIPSSMACCPLPPPFKPSPSDLLDNLFISWVSNEKSRDLYYRLHWSFPWWSFFDGALTSTFEPVAFEPSSRDLLDNLFFSWEGNEISRDFYYRLQWSFRRCGPSSMAPWPPPSSRHRVTCWTINLLVE